MNLGHPVLQEMLSLGCNDQNKVLLSFQTYLDLCETYNFDNVEFHYNAKLDLIYLSAVEDSEKEFYLPLSFNDHVTASWMKHATDEICCNQKKNLHIVIRDADTSHVIYRITDGLQEPLHPDASKELKASEEKKMLIDAEIRRMVPNLLQEAQNNLGQ